MKTFQLSTWNVDGRWNFFIACEQYLTNISSNVTFYLCSKFQGLCLQFVDQWICIMPLPSSTNLVLHSFLVYKAKVSYRYLSTSYQHIARLVIVASFHKKLWTNLVYLLTSKCCESTSKEISFQNIIHTSNALSSL